MSGRAVPTFATARPAARFAVVGIINTAIDMGLFVLLHRGFGIDVVAANVLGFLAAVANSYVLNKLWTFEDRTPFRLGQSLRFLAVALVGLAISTAVVALGARLVWPEIAKAAAIVATFAWNFVASRRFVFPGKSA